MHVQHAVGPILHLRWLWDLTNTSIATGCSGYSAPTFSQTYDANNHAGTVDSNGNPASIYLPQAGSSMRPPGT